MKQIKKLTVLALLGVVSAAALASGMDQAGALELRDHKPVNRLHVQLEGSESESESDSEEDEHAYVQQEAHHQLGKWTNMDSAIRDAEDAILYGGNADAEKRAKGELTTLSGFNAEYDGSVTTYHQPGDPAMDDDFLQRVFHRHYTRDGTTMQGDGPKILTKDNALLASKEVVEKWDHLSSTEADQYLHNNFERVWQHYDLNNEGKIKVGEAYNFEKSLLGSFSITYSEE